MKRLILIATFLLTAGTLAAQNYIIVNSEQVFRSVDAYNTALTDLDNLAEQYQNRVNARFDEVEAMYNEYMSQRASLSAATRQAREEAILAREQEAKEYQESLLGTEGTLMIKRLALIQPIQKEVFAAIETYAKSVGAELVIDSANNPTLLFTSDNVDRTEQVIDILKKK